MEHGFVRRAESGPRAVSRSFRMVLAFAIHARAMLHPDQRLFVRQPLVKGAVRRSTLAT